MARHGRIGLMLLWVAALARPQCFAVASDDFAAAARAYNEQHWQQAANGFRLFLERNPDHGRSGDAMFFLGESYVQLGDQRQAQDALNRFLQTAADHPQRARALFRLGEMDYLAGSDATAQQLLEQFVTNHRDHDLYAYALPYLGDIAWQQGDLDRASRYYKQAYEQFKRHPLAGKCLCYIGVLHVRKGEYAQADLLLRQFLATYPNHPLQVEATYWLGRSELAQGRAAQAADMLTVLFESNPSHAQASSIGYFAGRAHRKAGNLPEAGRMFQMVTSSDPSSQRAHEAAYERILLTNASSSLAVFQRSVESFHQAYPDSGYQGDVNRLLARKLLDEKSYPEASALLSELVGGESEGDAATARMDRYLLSLARLGQQDYRGTLTVLGDEPLEQWPAELQRGVLTAKAGALMGLEEYQAAVDQFQDYLRRYPESDDVNRVRADMARALTRMGNLNEAETLVPPRAPQEQPTATGAVTAPDDDPMWATLEMAEAAYREGQHAKASELFGRATTPDIPENIRRRAWSGLGWANYQQAKWEPAVDAFSKVLELNPDAVLGAEALQVQGRAYEELQQWSEAIRVYETLLQREPTGTTAPSTHIQLARWYSRTGDMTQAIRHLDTVIDQFAGSDQVAAAHYLRAWLAKDNQDSVTAAEHFVAVAERHRASEYWDDSVYRLADMEATEKHYDKSRQLLEELLRNGKDRDVLPYAHYLHGQMLAGLQRWSEVPGALEPLITNYPEHNLQTAAEFWIAEAYYRQAQYALAEPRFSVLAANTLPPTASWAAMVPLRRAQIMAQRGDWQQALVLANQIEPQYPNFKQQYEVDYLRGRCYHADARFDEARNMFQRVVVSPTGRATETAAMAQWMIGETFFHQQRYKEALVAYTPVIQEYPFAQWQAASLLQAGKCSEQLAEPGKALAYYQQVVHEYAQFAPLKEQAMDRLRALQNPSKNVPQTATGL